MGRVAGKVAIITGGAKGIGEASARLLAAEGAKVVITDLDEQGGTALADELRAAGFGALFIKQDVADVAGWEAVVAKTIEEFGGLHIVVNSAGVAHFANVEEETLERWRFLNSINSDAVFLGTQAGIKGMRQTGEGGSIINLASIEGIVGDPNLTAYNASKGSVRIFSKSAALHCAKSGYGIRVNSVHPGYIWTPMVQGVVAGDEAMKQGLVDLHPIGRLGTAEDIAYAILYLASDESSFVTGSELVIDGGYTAQ